MVEQFLEITPCHDCVSAGQYRPFAACWNAAQFGGQDNSSFKFLGD